MTSTTEEQRDCEGNPHSIKVLMYHRVVSDRATSEAHWTALQADDFRRQMQLLDHWGFTPVTFHDYECFREGKLDLPRKPIVITFDDGYLDTFEVAFPILREFSFKAVIFALGQKGIRTNFWDRGRQIPEAPLMQGHHLLELHEAGMEIGSHSLTHGRLTEISDTAMWEEISRSRILLELLLDAPVHSFSYPYGLVNSRAKEAVKQSGYHIACAVGSGPPSFGADHWEIRRITITNHTGPFGFALRLLTPFQYYEWTRHKAGRAIRRGVSPQPAPAQPKQILQQEHVE